MKDEYEQKADEFMTKTGTTMNVKFLRHGKHFVDDKDDRDVYEITLSRNGRYYVFNFGQSIAHSGKYTYYSSTKGKIVTNDKTQLNKLVGRHVSLGECRINKEQQEPNSYDILSCLTKYDPESFQDFCDNFGYDNDSIKHKIIYDSVVSEWNNVKMLYNEQELEMLRKIE